MSSPLEAAYFADGAVQTQAEIVENRLLAKDTYLLRLAAPEIARQAAPGQFLMVKLAGWNDPLIGRPLALYDTYGDEGSPDSLAVVYLRKGKFTQRLSTLQPGQLIDVWGPLGNGFEQRSSKHLVMVAGGIGQTPFLAVAKEALGARRYGGSDRQPLHADRVTFCYGARTAAYLTSVDDFEKLGADVRIATDDGSRGHHGLVTEVLAGVLSQSQTLGEEQQVRIVCCGPEPMMQAVAGVAARSGVACQVSLETPMACGIGICFTCVAKVRDEAGEWDYKRTCVEGPVFDAEKIEW